jgi:hypothetical protein
MKPEDFCSGVKILLERMQTNPEDFELHDFNPTNMTEVRGKFYDFAKAMNSIVTGMNKQHTLERWSEWHMLTRAEHNALIEGYKMMRRNKFDADILTRMMDNDYEKRQRDAIEVERQSQRAMMQNAVLRASPLQHNITSANPMIAGGTITTAQSNSTGGGFFGGLANSLGMK